MAPMPNITPCTAMCVGAGAALSVAGAELLLLDAVEPLEVASVTLSLAVGVTLALTLALLLTLALALPDARAAQKLVASGVFVYVDELAANAELQISYEASESSRTQVRDVLGGIYEGSRPFHSRA